MAVHGLGVREHALRNALADDSHELLARAVIVIEIAARDHRDADHVEEVGRHNPEARARVLFAVRRFVALDGELESRPESACVAPRHEAPDRDAFDPWQLADAPYHLFIEIDDLQSPVAGR